MIPTFDESRKRSATNGHLKSPRKHEAGEELLIDFSTPASMHRGTKVSGAELVQDPFSPLKPLQDPTGVAQNAIKAKESEEARKAQEKLVFDYKVARRKSMGNRRVSFAPEATLHTWNEVEMVEESTTSSGANSTRRQSSIENGKSRRQTRSSEKGSPDQSEPPSTPPTESTSPIRRASPARQQHVYQKRSSRSSQTSSDTGDMSPTGFYSSSSVSGDSSPLHVDDSINSSSDDDGDTAMSLEDVTGQTLRSELSGSSTGSSLDERLRKAAAEAGTRGIAYDESAEDLSMELAEGTVTDAFQLWVNNQSHPRLSLLQDASSRLDQENINPFSAAFKRQIDTRASSTSNTSADESGDLTMEMTMVGGGLIQQGLVHQAGSVNALDDDLGEAEEVTMDMTRAGGGLLEQASQQTVQDDRAAATQNEDMTVEVPMDMTVAGGGLMRQEAQDMALEMTTARRQFLDPGQWQKEEVGEKGTVGDDDNKENEGTKEEGTMDLTMAAGTIMSPKQPPVRQSQRPKISLNDFLDMTKIHFMELSAAKRRHTAAPLGGYDSSSASSGLIAAWIAAATTVPLLELYQHATRELKSYISTGRGVIQSVEQEALEDEPTLFREYLEARPDTRLMMDNQLRNTKANARLESKAGWYEWRMKLVEGLRSGLNDIKAGMEDDSQALDRQAQVLRNTIPSLADDLNKSEEAAQVLQRQAREAESIDREALNRARSRLKTADQEVGEKTALLEQLRKEITDKDEARSLAAEMQLEYAGQISEAERVLDECRGWKVDKVKQLQKRVHMLETRSGWSLSTAENEEGKGEDFGPSLTMRYRETLRLFFYPTAFQRSEIRNGRRRSRRSISNSQPSAPLSLTYAPTGGSTSASAILSTQERFFLQFLQGQLHSLAASSQLSVSPTSLLAAVTHGWDMAKKVSAEVQLLEVLGITTVSILSDEQLQIKCMLKLPDRSRVDLRILLTVLSSLETTFSPQVDVEAIPRYGPVVSAQLHGAQMSQIQQVLNKQASSRPLGDGAWAAAARGLGDWLQQERKEQEEQQKTRTWTRKAAIKSTLEKAVQQLSPEKTLPGMKAIASPPIHKTSSVDVETDSPTTIAAATNPTVASGAIHATMTAVPTGSSQRKGLKRPVPMEEVMEEAAARQEEISQIRKQQQQEEDMTMTTTNTTTMMMSTRKAPAAQGRRPGALRRSP